MVLYMVDKKMLNIFFKLYVGGLSSRPPIRYCAFRKWRDDSHSCLIAFGCSSGTHP